MYKVGKRLLKSVTEAIDTVYEFAKDGFDGSFKNLNNSTVCKVVSELNKRGVLKRTKYADGRIRYDWVAASAPTKTFYASVATAMGMEQRLRDQKYNAKKKAEKEAEKKASEAVSEVAPTHRHAPEVETPSNDLKSASIEELWAELKSRGAVIENNRLVIIEKRVIA